MKIKAVIIAAAMMTIGLGAATAQTTTTTTRTTTWNWHDRFAYDTEGDRFRANEFSVDMFGSFLRGEADDIEDFFTDTDGTWGGGIGVNYFFTRWIGLGTDASIHSNRGAFVDFANVSVILRVPIDAISMAPYVFGGGGRTFDPDDAWTMHGGVGLEFRLNANTGIFIDGRYVWAENGTISDYSQLRSGLRFAF